MLMPIKMNRFPYHLDTLRNHENATSNENVSGMSHPLNSTVPIVESTEETLLSSDHNAFLSLLMSAPVTDVTTEMVYRNRAVAKCYGVLDSDILVWKVQVQLASIKVKPQDLRGLSEIVDTTISAYKPPDTPPSSSPGSGCIGYDIHRCKREELTTHPELEALCADGGITYYTTKVNGLKKFFRNIHCLTCNVASLEGSVPVVTYVPFAKTFKLSVMVSLYNGGTLRVISNDKTNFVGWKSVECSLPTETQKSQTCQDYECSNLYEKRPDGQCRRLQKVKFAMGANNCTFVNSKNLKQKFVAMIKCYLETYANVELITENIQLYTIYDTRLNLSLLEMSADVYYPSGGRNDATSDSDFTWHLAMLLYDASFCCGPPLPPAECSGNSCRLGKQKVPATTSRDDRKGVKGPNLSEQDTLAGIIRDSSMVFCETKLLQGKTESSRNCYQGPVYKSELGFYQRAANVPCFGDTVGQHALHVQQWRLCSASPGHGSWSSFSLHLVSHALLWTARISL